jgi:hypothetical protein
MSGQPVLHFPVFLPPEKDVSDPAGYYGGLDTVVDVNDLSDGTLEVTLTNPATLHPATQFDAPSSFATVVAPTRGLVRYYPAAVALPTGGGQPLPLPAGLLTPDIGTIVLQIWPGDQRRMGAEREAGEPLPTHIVLGGLQRASVEAACTPEVGHLKHKALKRGWIAAHGSATIPLDPALKQDYVLQFMTGNAELYVPAGTILGTCATVDDPPGTSKGWLRFGAFALDATDVATDVSADRIVADIITDARARNSTLLDGHPLAAVADQAAAVQFDVQAMIWDRVARAYVPFENGGITLVKKEGNAAPIQYVTVTDATGLAHFQANLKKRDQIAFEYDTNQKTMVHRTFPRAITSLFRSAKYYTNPSNVRQCYAKYEIADLYEAFWNTLRLGSNDEKFYDDRGNAELGSFVANQEDKKIKNLKKFEQFYIDGPATTPTFNVLFEGDSWMDYPLALDTFNHLNSLFRKHVKSSHNYNCISLQHFGDRSDQMFQIIDNMGEGQWKYTADILSEYPIDLIVVSSGGNDIAEPGISWKDQARYAAYWTDGYFDPYLASAPQGLSAADLAIAERLMKGSFAALLSNHRWNLYLSGATSQANADALLAPKLAALGNVYGLPDASLDEIGNLVIGHFPNQLNFPPNNLNKYDDIIAGIFDQARLAQRFVDVKTNLEKLLDLACTYNIKVVTHTYAYPLFREVATSILGDGDSPLTGPWFSNRLDEAFITDRRVQKIALKSLIDNYVRLILAPIKSGATYAGMFDFADLRPVPLSLNWRLADNWRDEMHLRSEPYKALAQAIYDVAAPMFTNKLD